MALRFPAPSWALPLLGLSLGAGFVACGSDADPPGRDGAGGEGGASGGASGSGGGGTTRPEGFVRRSGRLLVDEDGTRVRLHGVAFGNNIWAGLSTPPPFHHDEADFARLESMGMNLVRFYLNYQLFESDDAPYEYRQTGWDWLDRNVAWAKAHGVWLLLNMHYPQGGFQSNGDGDALWDDPENQARLLALWKAIAERYADEPTVLGYDLVNEPRPTVSRAQWQELATRLVLGIREVAKRQLVVVERILSAGDDWSVDDDQNFFLVPDDNAVYQFHTYSPLEYTHQFADWIGLGDGGKYPDESRISSANLTWSAWSWSPAPPPYAPPGDSDWTYYESEPYAVPDGVAVIAPVLVSELNAGSVWFDGLVVKEFDASGEFVHNVIELDLESLDGWTFWKEGATGSASRSNDAHSGNASLLIEGTDHDANLQNEALRFQPKAEHRYSIGGFMKGANISDDSRPDPRGDWTQESRAFLRLDFFTADGPVLTRNKAALAAELDRVVAWGEKNDVPLYLGEFGVIRHCFENDRGGLSWVEDMLDLALERDLSFTYHSYHELAFPIYRSDPTTTLPRDEDAIPGLVELFREKLRR